MKNLFKALSAICFFSALSGCSTDFDVVAPYKELIVVNGLLDPLDSIHYVRISKAFLGEGNVYEMASVSDSVNYADVLDVKLERWYAGDFLESYPMTRDTSVPKDSGAFAYPFQVLYGTTHAILQDGSEYRLVVTNTQTGVTATSKTKVVKDVHVNTPIPGTTIDLVSAYPSPVLVQFDPGANTAFLDLIVRFRYREIDPNGVSTEKYVDWNFEDKNSGSASLQFRYYKYNFFQHLGNNIPEKPGFTRRVDSLADGKAPFEYIMIGGSEDLQTYMALNNSSGGLVQDRPTFSTVNNGLGLFTGRVLHKEYRNFSASTQAAFDTISYVRNLNFQF